MKNTRWISLSIIFLLFVALNSYSQDKFSFHGGLSLPISEFANQDIGGATIGGTVGIYYVYPITKTGLGLFGGVDIYYNQLKGNVKSSIEAKYNEANHDDVTFRFPSYLNIPFSGGIKYEQSINTNISLFANMGITVNFFKITDLVVCDGDYKTEIVYFIPQKIGYKVGGGVLINNKSSISINYLALGEHHGEGIAGYKEFEYSRKVDILSITYGIIIK